MKRQQLGTYLNVELMEALDKYIAETGETKVEIIERALAEYLKKGQKNLPNPRVTFSAKYTYIRLDKRALELLQSDRVLLDYDPEGMTFRIAASNNEEGIKVSSNDRVFCSGFFNKYSITVDGTYEAEYNQDERALYVKI